MESFKIRTVILGCSNIGKSTMIMRLINNTFCPDINNTIGASFFVMNMNGIKISLWDTAGQERFTTLMPMYYRSANIIILAYDTNDLSTLDRIKYYADEIKKQKNLPTAFLFVGLKTDLLANHEIYIKDKLKNIDQVITEFIAELDIPNTIKVEKIYVSSLNGHNITDLKQMLFEISSQITNTNFPEKNTISLTGHTGHMATTNLDCEC